MRIMQEKSDTAKQVVTHWRRRGFKLDGPKHQMGSQKQAITDCCEQYTKSPEKL